VNAGKTKLTLSEPLAASLLLLLSMACAGFLFAQPRKVAPRELPSLLLPEAPVRAVIAADRAAAQKAPTGPRVSELEKLHGEQGTAEARGTELEGESYEARRFRLMRSYQALVAERGRAAGLALRAKQLERLEDALAQRLPAAERDAVMGSFATLLARDGVTRDGYVLAAHFVIRTLYKARWNVMHGLSPDHAFASIEKRTYYGWQALHSEHVPLTRRLEALQLYAKHGGQQVDEAAGVLLYKQGDFVQATNALEAAHRKRKNLRLGAAGQAAAAMLE
jgi:hypothetical protein